MLLNRLDRYILKIAAGAAVVLLLGLTGVIWVTQALREVDLITGKGQTVLIFLTVTLLSLPALLAGIAPVALFMSTLYTLNKLNGDSELIVMNAAGVHCETHTEPSGFADCPPRRADTGSTRPSCEHGRRASGRGEASHPW